MRTLLFFMMLVFINGPALSAQKKFSVDGGECGGDVTVQPDIQKTAISRNAVTGRRAYGVLGHRRTEEDVRAKRCSVVYRLMMEEGQGKFSQMTGLDWHTEEGEIAGVDLIGFSSDGTKLVADFWLAEGDGTEHRVKLVDLKEGKSSFRSINDEIYKHSTEKLVDSENYYETLESVRDDGQVVVIAHADGGRKPDGFLSKWLFDPKTGRVMRIAEKR